MLEETTSFTPNLWHCMDSAPPKAWEQNLSPEQKMRAPRGRAKNLLDFREGSEFKVRNV